MRTVYREKKYICGEYMDVYIYPVFQTGKPSGGKRTKRKPSTEAQKKLNERHSKEKLTRLLHANFTPEDLEIHLTHKVQPESKEEAERLLRNWIRRVQRLRKKQGLSPMKYITVTEQGKKSGRYHHHVTVNGGIDRDTLEAMWTHGYANSRRLQFTDEGLAALGNYIVKYTVEKKAEKEDEKKAERKAGKRAWRASKNLVDPQPQTRDGRISGKKARELAENIKDNTKFEKLYPGYLMSGTEAFHNDVNGGCYLAARFYKKDGIFIKPGLKRRI